MATESAMLAAVGAIYDAGLDPASWPAALELMAAMLGTNSAAVGFQNSTARIAYRNQVRADERAITDYTDRYRLLDAVIGAVSLRPPGKAFSDEMIRPKAELWRSRFHDEWCRPHDMEHAIQGFAFRDGDGGALLAFARPRRQEAFGVAEVDVVTALLPHVARAFRVQLRLQAAQVGKESSAAALDRMPQAVMLVDPQARVLHANQAAGRLLRGAQRLDAGPLGLRACSPEQTKRLRGLIAHASEPGPNRMGGSMMLHPHDAGATWVVHVVPCRKTEVAWLAGGFPTCIVTIVEPRRDGAVDVEMALKALFGLTRAEARVACLIAKGLGEEGVAGALGTMPSTVHSQLLRTYRKTGTERQAALAELIAQVASAVGSGPVP